MICYMLFDVRLDTHKTLNAVLLDNLTAGWGYFWSRSFVLITLVSEAALLFVAAQTGFIDGPRIMANMAIDHWFPKRFAVSQRSTGDNERSFVNGYRFYYSDGYIQRFSRITGCFI